MAYIDYQPQSAAQAVGNVLQLAQIEDTRNQNRRNMIFEGIKAGGKVIGDVMGYQKRKAAIQYLGDDKLAEMKQQLAALKNELVSVENQMKTIKAEDVGSLDINQDLSAPAETDVNAWNAVGGRMTETPVNTPFGTQDASMMKKPGLTALGGF